MNETDITGRIYLQQIFLVCLLVAIYGDDNTCFALSEQLPLLRGVEQSEILVNRFICIQTAIPLHSFEIFRRQEVRHNLIVHNTVIHRPAEIDGDITGQRVK
ncbi:hypothetical protein D3C84_1065140 [compost metagenome]